MNGRVRFWLIVVNLAAALLNLGIFLFLDHRWYSFVAVIVSSLVALSLTKQPARRREPPSWPPPTMS